MFEFNFDKRIIYILLAIFILYGISSYVTSTDKLLGLLLTIPGVLIAITFHEFAHAFVADKMGDDTPRLQGRLTLNPFAHMDPVGTLLLLFAGFGWGKPVQVNPKNYTGKLTIDKADALVSIAGPVMNLVLAFVFSLIYYAIYKFAEISFLMSTTGQVIMLLINYTVIINVGLGIFNLIPLPPLDGSKVIKPFLSYNAKQWFSDNEKIFYIIFIIIWITGIASTIISPAITIVTNGIMNLSKLIFRI